MRPMFRSTMPGPSAGESAPDIGVECFLADLFSAVDYTTGFTTDHLHPNAAGLQAIAAEWLTRVQALTIRTNQFTTVCINGVLIEILGPRAGPRDELGPTQL